MWADVSHAEPGHFKAAFEAHTAHLHDYCRSLLGDSVAAADAAQATLVIASSLLDRLRDTGRVRAWLLALARRECLSADPVRYRLPKSAPPSDWIQDDGGGAGAILRALPAAEREVLDLVYRHYLSSTDLAAVLGVSAEHARELLADATTRAREYVGQAPRPEGKAGALVAGVRVISTIPLLAMPASLLADATSIVLDAEFAPQRDSLTSSFADIGPDGFPAEPAQPPSPDPALHISAHRKARGQRAIAVIAPRRRLVMLGALLAASTAGLAVLASSSSGVPNQAAHTIGQAPGQDPADASRASTRRATSPLPITALFPKKQDKGIILPILPAVVPARLAPSQNQHQASAPPSGTPSATPTSPSPTPTSPSPTPTSPSPTPTSPSPTATATP